MPIQRLDRSDPFLYQQVIERVTRLIQQGVLKPGEKAPSLRKLSKQLNISIATITQAYREMEEQGLLESRPKSGYFVRSRPRITLPEPETSQPMSVAQHITADDMVITITEQAGKRDVAHLGAATLHMDLMPVNELASVTASIARKAKKPHYFYEFPPGNEGLRLELAKQSIDWGCSLTPDDLIITTGALEALNLSLRAVAKPGSTIAVESPAFYGVLQTLANLGMYALEIPTSPRTGMDLNVLEYAIKHQQVDACVVIPNFNNPLGHLMPEENKARLAAMAGQYQIPVIEDDIYGDMYYGNQRPNALKAYDKAGYILYCSSFSKSLCPGFRVGWCAPGRYYDTIRRLQFMTSVCPPTIPQIAVAEFLKTGKYMRHMKRLRPLMAQQMTQVSGVISEHFPKNTRISRPQGGFLLWVELPEHIHTVTLQKRAREHSISIAPGPIFSSTGEFSHCLRLSCGQPWTPQIERALQTLGKLCV